MNKDNQYKIISTLFLLLPLIIFFWWLSIAEVPLTNLTPDNNDSQSWYNQARCVAKYGRPLAYHGYREGHAPVGTFGPWGAFMVYFVAFGLRLFGSYSWSPMLINAVKWMLANICFFILTNHPVHLLRSHLLPRKDHSPQDCRFSADNRWHYNNCAGAVMFFFNYTIQPDNG